MRLQIVTDLGFAFTTVVIRVLNGSARPNKPYRTRRFGSDSGRKNTRMSRVGSGLGLPFL